MLNVLVPLLLGFSTLPRMDMTKKYDYVVVGAGASGMSFVDTLLSHSSEPLSIVLLDKRTAPGGHWNDAYGFVTLHQPARNYGVESTPLESGIKHPELLASREEVLAYYRTLLDTWRANGHDVDFVGGAAYDFASSTYTTADGSTATVAAPARKVVDARFTENDLPLHVRPKFAYNAEAIDLIPPNELPERDAAAAREARYCVLGAGKTGQDTVLYLRRVLKVPLEHILWVMPTPVWITARDPPPTTKQITCMEFIDVALEAHAAAGAPADAAAGDAFLQRAFERLEADGRIYRIHPTAPPGKFMDATLNAEEVALLRECAPSICTGKGRVASIGDDGALTFAGGEVVPLPWAGAADGTPSPPTTFVHCTAGAFNFGASAAEAARPIFTSDDRITVQEVFQFPGFCFNGAVIAWLECQSQMSRDEKNRLCEMPPPADGPPAAPPLGPVAGNLGPLTAGHPLLVSLRNLRRWYATPGMGEWLHSLRLFSLRMNGYSLEEGRALAERNHAGLVDAGIERS